MKMQRRHQTSGFTLLEIMLVVGIIALLLAAVSFSLGGFQGQAERARVEADFKTMDTALQTYQLFNFTFPTSNQGLKALVEMPTGEPRPKRWQKLLEKIPEDPWGHPYRYIYPGAKNSGKYDIYSVGKDGQEGTTDDIGNWES